MSEQKLYLDQLKPGEALKILADAAMPGSTRALGNIRIIFPKTGFGNLVALEVPNLAIPLKKDGERVKVFNAMIGHYRQLRGQEPANRMGDGKAVPFQEGVSLLLLKGDGAEAGQPAPMLEDEHLIISENMGIERARDLFFRLQRTATSVKVCATTSHFLFHVKNDINRGSLFQGLATGGELHDCLLLNGFSYSGQALFLPQGVDPEASELRNFCGLLIQAPALFGMSPERLNQPLLAAFIQEKCEPGERVTFLDLTALGFMMDFLLTRNRAEHVQFQLLNLKRDENTLRNLWTAVHRTHPPIGYRLGLRRTQHIEHGEQERLKLEESLADVRYKLAYLDSVSQPRPTLLRFGPQQLPALADVLRAFPMDILRDDRLLYGFHATESEPAGVHFLLIHPDKAVMSELDPLVLWQEPQGETMRFGLDPFWAKYYHRAETRSLVFTPNGTALTPTMHYWDPQSMDVYLRRVMEHWFQEDPQAAQIPEKPIFIFNGQPEANNQLQLSVLDRDAFQPLRLRLAWLSDNLLLYKNLNTENLIQQMADSVTRNKLMENLLEKEGETRQNLEELALKTSEEVARTTNTMTKALTDRLNRTMDRTYVLIGKIRDLDKELEQWKLIEEEMQNLVGEVKHAKASLNRATETTRNSEAETEERIRRQIAVSEKNRQKLMDDIDEEIKALKLARTMARKRLKKLKVWE